MKELNCLPTRDFWIGKRVLVTGHTGFKGSWLSVCLANFGASVYGLSDRVPTKPSHYELLESITKDYWVDIRDSKAVNKVISDLKPELKKAIKDTYNRITSWHKLQNKRDQIY